MQTDVDKLIGQLESEIATRQTAVASLRAIYGAPATPTAHATNGESHAKRIVTMARKIISAAGKKPSVPNGLGKIVIEACQQCDVPFDQNMIHRAISKQGIYEMGQVRGALSYAYKKGQLVLVQPGRPGYPAQYRLSAKLKTAKPAPAPAAASKANREDLERKLADALKQRDHARSNGRDTMVDLFQKDIDALEAQLEAMPA